ncbi:TonB-dependent receptor plug domain-containing protein, partial [Iodobacter sp. LRB]
MKFPIKALALAIASISCVTFTFAAETTQAVNKVERVEVVGSSIKRISKEGVSLVTVIKREELEQTGAKTAAEALNALSPSSNGALGTADNSFSKGAATADLRGMGAKNVLVLVNGRRVAPHGLANFDSSAVNLNSLPLDMIEEIQILSDGASAIYGSDAVSGVINFKTKQNFEGYILHGSTGANLAGDAENISAMALAGFGKLNEDGYNLQILGSVSKSKPSIQNKHDLTKNLNYSDLGGTDDRSAATPGSYYDVNAGKTYAIPGCTEKLVTSEKGDVTCRTDLNHKQDGANVESIGLNLQFNKLLGENAELFSEFSINRATADFTADPLWINGNSHVITPNHAAYRKEVDGRVTKGNLQITRYIFEAPRKQSEIQADMLRAVLGV